MKIGFAGMTHLGLYSAVAAIERGFEVETLNYNDCAVVYVTLDITTDEHDNIDPRPIYKMVRYVAKVISEKTPIVVLSQVPPGFCRSIERDNLYFQVDTLRLRDAFDRAVNPEQIVIGTASGAIKPYEADALMEYLSAFECSISCMTYESAEMVQKAININLAAQVSVTNTLSELCAKIGADWADVARALKLDKRIGPHAYLQPGKGLSGGHLERDIQTIRRLGEEHGINTDVVRSFIEHSKYRKAKP